MPDDTALLRFAADYAARSIHQENRRQAGLVAQLRELPGLGRAACGAGAVVAEQAYRHSVDARLPAEGVRIVFALEPANYGCIDQARDRFAAVAGLAAIDRNDAAQRLHVVQGFAARARRQMPAAPHSSPVQ